MMEQSTAVAANMKEGEGEDGVLTDVREALDDLIEKSLNQDYLRFATESTVIRNVNEEKEEVVREVREVLDDLVEDLLYQAFNSDEKELSKLISVDRYRNKLLEYSDSDSDVDFVSDLAAPQPSSSMSVVSNDDEEDDKLFNEILNTDRRRMEYERNNANNKKHCFDGRRKRMDSTKSTCTIPDPILSSGECKLSDLPPIEKLSLDLGAEAVKQRIGIVSCVVDSLVVIKSDLGIPPLDIDSLVFVPNGNGCGTRPLGHIFETFGPVTRPMYSVRFNGEEDIEELNLQLNETEVSYAPQEAQFTKTVFTEKLRKEKHTDASTEDNRELADGDEPYFSDDEEERKWRAKNRHRRRNQVNDGDGVVNEVELVEGELGGGGGGERGGRGRGRCGRGRGGRGRGRGEGFNNRGGRGNHRGGEHRGGGNRGGSHHQYQNPGGPPQSRGFNHQAWPPRGPPLHFPQQQHGNMNNGSNNYWRMNNNAPGGAAAYQQQQNQHHQPQYDRRGYRFQFHPTDFANIIQAPQPPPPPPPTFSDTRYNPAASQHQKNNNQ